MRPLRDYGIYVPPGGLRPVFVVRAEGVYHLYDVAYGPALPPRFTVRPDGAITDWHGERVDWAAEDLRDAGETYGR